MISLLRRKARSALWRVRNDWGPYFKVRARGEIGYRLGKRWGPLRGWRHTKPSEIVWAEPAEQSDGQKRLVARLKDAYVYRDESIVIASDYRLMADLSTPPSGQVRGHDVMYLSNCPTPAHHQGNVALINAGMYDHFYHWMMESVPRFGLLESSQLDIETYFVSTGLKFQKDCLEVLNIDPAKVVCPKSNQMLLVKDLIAPSIVGLHAKPTQYAVQYLKKMFSAHLSTDVPTRRIYISREDAPARRVVNEAELVAALAPLGFEALRLTEFPLAEQARTISQAEIIIGPHGAGMTHVAFMQARSRGMIEFMPETYTHECFLTMSELNGTPYLRITSRSVDPVVHDMEVDIANIVDKVKKVLGLSD